MTFHNRKNFSYLQDTVNYVVIDEKLTLRIERITEDIARIYLVNYAGIQQPFPQHIRVTNNLGHSQTPFMNNIFITWFGNYTIYVNDEVLMKLYSQRQQSITIRNDTVAGVVLQ